MSGTWVLGFSYLHSNLVSTTPFLYDFEKVT